MRPRMKARRNPNRSTTVTRPQSGTIAPATIQQHHRSNHTSVTIWRHTSYSQEPQSCGSNILFLSQFWRIYVNNDKTCCASRRFTEIIGTVYHGVPSKLATHSTVSTMILSGSFKRSGTHSKPSSSRLSRYLAHTLPEECCTTAFKLGFRCSRNFL